MIVIRDRCYKHEWNSPHSLADVETASLSRGNRMSFWVVAQTQPLRERLAADELKQSGFDVYFPRIRIRHDRRWRVTGLFPSYLFLQISDNWYRARWCRGILR